MIRIPKYWTYFIFALLCLGLVFQNNSHLFAAIGINYSFNFLARIGIFVWVIWLVILGGRGHVIYWSYFRDQISYGDFPGGYGILYGAFGLGLILILLGALTAEQNIINSSAPKSFAPTNTARNSLPPQFLPTPTKILITYNNLPCASWNVIDKYDIDSNLCVYGKIFDYGPYKDKWNTIYFSSRSDAFRVIDFNGFYGTPLQPGDCVRVYGKIRDNNIYLLIAPELKNPDRITIYSSSMCD
jgi:hypothetical protein